MIPTLADLRGSVWAMSPSALGSFVASVSEAARRPLPSRMDVVAVVGASPSPLAAVGGQVRVPVHGVLMRGRSNPFLSFFGVRNTGHEDIRDGIKAALEDPAVHEIVLDVDSPGGEAQGIVGLADLIRDADKPVRAEISGTGASAAYWLASQADELVAEPDAIVGSIGAYSVVADSSEAFARDGVKVHVIASGEHKGAGVPGAEVTTEQIKMHQSVIDGIADGFVQAVSAGRNLDADQAAALATGAHWLAKEAQALGLVDRVSRSTPTAAVAQQEEPMQGSTVPASLADLKSRFGDPSFVLEQLEAQASMDQASVAWTNKQARDAKAKLAELEAENAELKASIRDKAVGPVAVVAPVANVRDDGAEDPEESRGDFLEQAKAYQREHGGSMTEALKTISRKHPDLHEQYVQGRINNTKPRRRR